MISLLDGSIWHGDCPLCGKPLQTFPPRPAMFAFLFEDMRLHPNCYLIIARFVTIWFEMAMEKGFRGRFAGKPPWYLTNYVNSLVVAWLEDHGLIEIGQVTNTFKNQPSVIMKAVKLH